MTAFQWIAICVAPLALAAAAATSGEHKDDGRIASPVAPVNPEVESPEVGAQASDGGHVASVGHDRDAGHPKHDAAASEVHGHAAPTLTSGSKPEEDPAPAKVPPGVPALTAEALCAELRGGGDAAGGLQLEAQRAHIAEQRAALEAMIAQLKDARAALAAETARLSALGESAKRANTSASASLAPANAAKQAAGAAAPPSGDAATAGDQKGSAAEHDRRELENIKTLAKTMRTMKADQAAELLGRLDKALAVALMQQLSPASSGAILARLKPEMAAQIVGALAKADGKKGASKR